MIKAIIFDFGDIFINLNPTAVKNAFQSLGLEKWNSFLDDLNVSFEKGLITEEAFLKGVQSQAPMASLQEIKEAWNLVLADFPDYRLEFLKKLATKYPLFLLSNTDSIHIKSFETRYGTQFASDFYNCFKKVYFSYDLGMRKPHAEIYQYVLDQNNLDAQHTLFVDDKKANTDCAAQLGIRVWNLQVGQEDVVDLDISKHK
jgi:glucose-1-phosphatase